MTEWEHRINSPAYEWQYCCWRCRESVKDDFIKTVDGKIQTILCYNCMVLERLAGD